MDNLGAAILNGAPVGPCGACGQIGHSSQDCQVGNPSIVHEDANFVSNGGRSNFNPYSNTYNPGWRSHPNFSWSNNQQQGPARPLPPRQPPPQEPKSNLEEMFSKFITATDTRFQNQDASIRNIEMQLGQLAIKHPRVADHEAFSIDCIEMLQRDCVNLSNDLDPITDCIVNSDRFESQGRTEESRHAICHLDAGRGEISSRPRRYLPLGGPPTSELKPSIEKPPILELKPLPSHLKYIFLGEDETLPVIISSDLTGLQEEKLKRVLRENIKAIGWSIADIRGISPVTCTHKILMEEAQTESTTTKTVEPQHARGSQKKILKWLAAGIIYPISDSMWVSPVQCVPKKGGMTVVTNEQNELIPTRTVTGWRVCIDYRALNDATRKDHFPLPFIDQMVEKLAGHAYYCFLDGYSGYHQVAIAPEDQEKTTFTCPYGTFAFRRMPFGLCNAPATFQRCMISVFGDFIDHFMEVFMDDFSVYASSFNACLVNLGKVLQRCEETNLVLNWEKCHFMVKEGIVLGHKVSYRGIEVDKGKVDLIAKLPPPQSVKEVRGFLGHAGFYRRFIKDFSKIAKPLTNLLSKDAQFHFDDACLHAFRDLKEKLTTAPIVSAPAWDLPFEIMCDASNDTLGAVLGQRVEKRFHTIYYASRTMNDAQRNYATTEKELLAVIFAIEKFRPYLLLSKNLTWKSRTGGDVRTQWPTTCLDSILPMWRTCTTLLCKTSFLMSNYLLSQIEEPWFADFANFLAGKVIPPHLSYQQKKKFFSDIKYYLWDEPYLYKRCGDGMVRRCVPEEEMQSILGFCHDREVGGHHGGAKTAAKVLQCGFYWPSLFKDAHKSKWSGPYTVTTVFPHGAVELLGEQGPFKVNGHRSSTTLREPHRLLSNHPSIFLPSEGLKTRRRRRVHGHRATAPPPPSSSPTDARSLHNHAVHRAAAFAQSPRRCSRPFSMDQPGSSRSRRRLSKNSVTLPPAEADLGGNLHFRSQRHRDRYATISQCVILPGKSLHRPTMIELLICDRIDALTMNSCWRCFCEVRHPIFVELVREFYTTFEFEPPAHLSTPNAVKFRLCGRAFHLSITDFNLALGFIDSSLATSEDYLTSACDFPDSFVPQRFYLDITTNLPPNGRVYDSSKTKDTYVRDPALKYLHRFLAFTFSGRKDSSAALNKTELFFLWSMLTHTHVLI
ncbi:UNVERIFIED_CONTAM: Retrovirus-related Pol polyprotein from transposon opus [Sesamum radiatum]|uniref:Retrovirus-related Pol polyprotein from transposon opus n=1 Tax=Sesamum radiatum TaxID=300843 RepID=A0AAW2T5F4_SESRA